MEKITITQEWKTLAEIASTTEDKTYTIQNNDMGTIDWFIGSNPPAENQAYGVIYEQGGQLKNILYSEFGSLYLRISINSPINQTKRTVLF